MESIQLRPLSASTDPLAHAVTCALLSASLSLPPGDAGPRQAPDRRQSHPGFPSIRSRLIHCRLVAYGDMRFTDPAVTSGTNPRVRKWLAGQNCRRTSGGAAADRGYAVYRCKIRQTGRSFRTRQHGGASSTFSSCPPPEITKSGGTEIGNCQLPGQFSRRSRTIATTRRCWAAWR